MLKPGGKLCLRDTVFCEVPGDYEAYLDGITTSNSVAPSDARTRHIREEFTTTDWIMEGMLTHAGFAIEKADYNPPFWANYLCTKEAK